MKKNKDKTRSSRQAYNGSKQNNFSKNFIEIIRRNQLIRLMQWLHDECFNHEVDSKKIIREFFKKSNEMRRGWL